MVLLDNIYWNINKNVSESKIYNNNEIFDIDNDLLKKIIFNKGDIKKVYLPFTYNTNKITYDVDILEGEYNLSDVLLFFQNFYNDNITEHEYTLILNTYNNNLNLLQKEFNKHKEEFNNLLSEILQNKENNINDKRIKLLGNRHIFEGLLEINKGEFRLLLGE